MAYLGSPNYAGVPDEWEWDSGQRQRVQRDVDNPLEWTRGQTQFTPENVGKQWRRTQEMWRQMKRDLGDEFAGLPEHLLDPRTKWTDPGVRDFFGVNPDTLMFEGTKGAPYSNSPGTSFGKFLLTRAAPFFLGGSAIINSLAAPAAGAAGADAATTGLFDAMATPGGYGATGASGTGSSFFLDPGSITNFDAFSSLDDIISGVSSGADITTGALGTPSQIAEITSAIGTTPSAINDFGLTGLIQGTLGGPAGVGGGVTLPSVMGNELVSGSGQSFWESILNAAENPGEALQTALPYLKSVGGLVDAISGYFGDKELADQLNKIAQNADPFSSQRPLYQERLNKTFTDPNWLANDPTLSPLYDSSFIDAYENKDLMGNLGNENYLKQMSNRIKNDVAKQMSAKGFMNSGNYGMELGERLAQTLAPYSLQQQTEMARIRQNQAQNVLNARQQRAINLTQAGQGQQTFLGNLGGAQFGPSNASVSAGIQGAQAYNNIFPSLLETVGTAIQNWPKP